MLEIFIKDMKHFDNVDDILEYITKHTEWIAGFASGEGSFSAYAYVDAANTCTWGRIQFGIDFSISQLVGDRILLEAINAYFRAKMREEFTRAPLAFILKFIAFAPDCNVRVQAKGKNQNKN